MGMFKPLAKHNFFVEVLNSLAHDIDYRAHVPMSASSIDIVIASGLGPIFYHVLARSGAAIQIDRQMKLKAADITARVMSAEQFQNVERTIGVLHQNDVNIIVLKGVSFALRFYPEPHMRVMGDVDLLLPPQKIPTAEQILLADGFRKLQPRPGLNYDQHIHSAPLFHPSMKLWIELHRELMPSSFPSSQESPLNLDSIGRNIQRARVGPHTVHRFRLEFELLYLANSWCRDLTDRFDAGTRRCLVDCVLLLKAIERRDFDWDVVMRWSQGTHSGACLLVLLSYLIRSGAYIDNGNICESLMRNQKFVNRFTLRLMHNRIEKHLVLFEDFGPVLSEHVTPIVFEALLRKRPGWANVLAIPGSVLFPNRESRRFELAYQLGRIRSLFGSK
jgi:hypothetical protein